MSFERFTERARRVVVLAKDAAAQEAAPEVGIRHILIGLTAEEDGLAARLLFELGASWTAVEADKPSNAVSLKLGIQAKTAMEVALREALSLGHNYIGTEHILLAVLRDPEGVVLIAEACPDVNVRQLVMDRLQGSKIYGQVKRPQRGKAEKIDMATVHLAVQAARASLDLVEALLKTL